MKPQMYTDGREFQSDFGGLYVESASHLRFIFQAFEDVDEASPADQVPAVSVPTVNFKVGNEKLIRVLDGASVHLRGLLTKQGRPDGALRIAVVGGGCSGL